MGFLRKNGTVIAALLLAAATYALIYDLIGSSVFAGSDWDSYTIQAMAWREGKLGLSQNYPWLELAVYGGGWYVSFPPFPSVVIFPLTFIFGSEVPSNLLVTLYGLLSILVCYKIALHFRTERFTAAFFALFAVMGSNLLWMTTNGGVWFQAQSLNFLLLSCALCCALSGRRFWAFLLTALAVGCRPFSICFFPLLLYMSVQREMEEGKRLLPAILCQWRWLIAPAAVGLCYMAYNYVRFGNVLEFGHNYLPEHTSSQYGQFNLRYIPQNLYNIFLRFVTVEEGRLAYPLFNGFAFYIANPVFLVWFCYIVRDAVKKTFTREKLLVICLFALELLLLCMHSTFGGWQFGARYTVDLIPFAFYYIFRSREGTLKVWEFAAGGAAMLFNLYGALAMYILYPA